MRFQCVKGRSRMSVRAHWVPFSASFKLWQKGLLHTTSGWEGNAQAASTPQSGVSLPNPVLRWAESPAISPAKSAPKQRKIASLKQFLIFKVLKGCKSLVPVNTFAISSSYLCFGSGLCWSMLFFSSRVPTGLTDLNQSKSLVPAVWTW